MFSCGSNFAPQLTYSLSNGVIKLDSQSIVSMCIIRNWQFNPMAFYEGHTFTRCVKKEAPFIPENIGHNDVKYKKDTEFLGPWQTHNWKVEFWFMAFRRTQSKLVYFDKYTPSLGHHLVIFKSAFILNSFFVYLKKPNIYIKIKSFLFFYTLQNLWVFWRWGIQWLTLDLTQLIH